MRRANQVRIALMIQVFHSFASGILGVVLPLMMKERGIDVILIGFVFASLPLIMQFGRMFFATISDFLGRKPFFTFNGVLGFVSGLVYYAARTPLEFLFGKITEGTKEGAIWAVNRAFLLEKSGGHWRILVYLRAVVYVAYSIGSLLAGFLVAWLLYEGTMIFCALCSIFVILLSIFLFTERKEKLSVSKALQFLDFRRKDRIFKFFLFTFFMMGLSFGFHGGFVIPLFLDKNGFSAEAVGLVIGIQILLAGFSSYFFSRSSQISKLIVLSGILYSATFFILGFTSSIIAAAFLIIYGIIEGMNSIGQEGILSKICAKESYGTDIGLLMMGLHLGESISLALSGILISSCGFAAPFLISALTYIIFYVGSYKLLK
ncbi:MAG: MFS transporter [Candidatus Bathycorpusculaceae bacterium]